jgi:hypothetical protein
MWINGRWVTYRLEGEGGGGGSGGGAGDWRAALPEDLRAHATLKDVKDVPGLAKAFIDTKALVGGSIRPPGPDAAPEAHREFAQKLEKLAPGVVYLPEDEKQRAQVEDSLYARLGRPKEAKDYAPPAGLELPPAAMDALRVEAHEEGLTKRQFEARVKRVATLHAAAQKAERDNQAALRKELGAAYDERIAAAAATAEKLGFPKGLVATLKAGTVDLESYRAVAGVTKAIGGEPRQVAGQGGGGGGTLTPDEARLQLAEIRQRPEYWDRSRNPILNEQLRRKVEDLTRAAYAE